MKLKIVGGSVLFAMILGMNYSELSKFNMEPSPVFAQDDLKSKVIDLDGSAFLLDATTKTRQPLEIGSPLNSEDQIIKPETSNVTILCSNGALWYVSDETSTVGDQCPSGNTADEPDLDSSDNSESTSSGFFDSFQQQPLETNSY